MKHVNAFESAPGPAYTVSERVIQAIADRESVSPLDISPPLFDAVDPDALDRLYDNRTGVTIQFRYSGYLVTVSGSGRIELTPLGD